MSELTQDYYYIMAFPTTKDAIAGESYAKSHLKTAIMPLPREISNKCGLALRFPHSTESEILDFCKNIPLPFALYRMDIRRVDGIRNIQKLLEHTE